jgi:hypothetical protein
VNIPVSYFFILIRGDIVINEAAMKPEYVFMCYDDIIRTHTVAVMRELLKMKDEYKDFIDYNLIENKSQNELMWLCNTRISYNILAHLAKKPFDHNMTLMNICRNIPDIYSQSSPLSFALALPEMVMAKFIKKIYIYGHNEEYIKDDIATLCGDIDMSKISIVGDDFDIAINSVPEDITLYIVNDVNMAQIILNCAKSDLADIMIAKYGYNYTYNAETKTPELIYGNNLPEEALKRGFRITYFMPIRKDYIDT